MLIVDRATRLLSREEPERFGIGPVPAIRKVLPHYGLGEFFGAFKYDADGAALFRKAAKLIGME